MNRFTSENDAGDYRLFDEPSEAAEGPYKQPAGYDLNGIGGQPIVTHDQNTMGRDTRGAVPLLTHEGIAQKGSDYDHPGERGFRFKQRFTGV